MTARTSLLFQDVFDFDNRPTGKTTTMTHRIKTGHEFSIQHRPYRVSASERRVIQNEVDKMLSKDIIQPSSIP